MSEINITELIVYAPVAIFLIAFITLLINLVNRFSKRRKLLNRYYSTIWKSSSNLKTDELMDIRPYNDYFFKRESDDKIVDLLNRKKNLLIVAPPLAGKTRSLYEALKNIDEPYNVIIPECIDIDLENHLLPKSFLFRRRKLIVIDELHRFVERTNFEHLIKIAIRNNFVIASTCQSSIQLKKVQEILVKKGIHLDLIFEEPPIYLKNIQKHQAKEIARKSGKDWDKIKFNGTVGSIYMRLAEIESRYISCSFNEKELLKTVKKLAIGGLYTDNNNYFIDHINLLLEIEGVQLEKYPLKQLLKSLQEKEILEKFDKKIVQIEEVYIEEIIKISKAEDELIVLKELLKTFEWDPAISHRIGTVALNSGEKRKNLIEYLEFSKTAFNKALKHWSPNKLSGNYAMVNNSLGIVYTDLARNKTPSFYKKAIFSFRESLKATNAQQNLDYYSLTILNLGNAYAGLGYNEEKEFNKRKAIELYKKSLEHFTIENFPYEYAAAMHNMASSYCALATIKEIRLNCKKAIEACNNALIVRTLEKFPIEYAATHHNLALAHYFLAKDNTVNNEERIEYCKVGIEACITALKIRIPDKYPAKYAASQGLLGSIYGRLLTIHQKKDDIKRNGDLAVNAIECALRIFDCKKFPIRHALEQKSLGVIYHNMARNIDTIANCKKAINAYEIAMEGINENDSPEIYTELKVNYDGVKKLYENNK